GEARHGIGHVQANALLAHDDRPDVDCGTGLDQMIDRIGEEIFDALFLQDVGDRRAGLHLGVLLWRDAARYLLSSFIALSRPPRVSGNMRLEVSCCRSWIEGV